MPSYRRFIVLEGDIQLPTGWMIPKCKRCNGEGWYLYTITGPAVVCRECPGWVFSPYERPTESEVKAPYVSGRVMLRDQRRFGGEISWVIIPDPNRLSSEAMRSVVLSQRKYGTDVFAQGMPRKLRQNPLV
jgi:hypothetical protein